MKAHFDSLSEYVQAALNPVVNHAGWNNWNAYSDTRWAGMEVATLPDVANVVRTGWNSGADRLAKVQERLDIPRLPSIRRHAVWSDRGDEVDMPRVYAGRLDTAWRRTQKSKCAQGRARVRIVVDSIAPASTDAEDMFWKGAAAALLADALTCAGYGVEVISAFKGSISEPIEVAVTVKPFNGPCTLPDVAATCAAPAFFRILGHAYVAGHLVNSGGGGMAVDTISGWPHDGQVVTFIAPQRITNETRCKRWIHECLAQLDAPMAA